MDILKEIAASWPLLLVGLIIFLLIELRRTKKKMSIQFKKCHDNSMVFGFEIGRKEALEAEDHVEGLLFLMGAEVNWADPEVKNISILNWWMDHKKINDKI